MWRSRELRAERWKLLAKHKERRLKEQREIASLHRKIRRADTIDLSKLEEILTDSWSLHDLQCYLHVIQRTPGPPPQAPPEPDPYDSDSDEPRAKTESVDDTKAKQDAILNVPEDNLRALIKLFAMSNDHFMPNVWHILKKKYKLSGERFTTKRVDPRPKRAAVVEDANLCDKCDKAFLESENGAESCVYHFRESVPSCLHGRGSDFDVEGIPRSIWTPATGTAGTTAETAKRIGRSVAKHGDSGIHAMGRRWTRRRRVAGRDGTGAATTRHVDHIFGSTVRTRSPTTLGIYLLPTPPRFIPQTLLNTDPSYPWSKLARVQRPVGAGQPA